MAIKGTGFFGGLRQRLVAMCPPDWDHVGRMCRGFAPRTPAKLIGKSVHRNSSRKDGAVYEVRYDHGPIRVRATDRYELTVRRWHDGTPGRTLTASVPAGAVVTAQCEQDARFWAAFALIAASRLFTEDDEDDDDGDGTADLPVMVEFGEEEIGVVCEIVSDDIVLPGLIADRAVLRSWV